MEAATAPPDLNTADFPYEFAIIPISDMFVDSAYQRPLTSFVQRIINDYQPALIGTLVLSARDDGRYAVVDGQTRMKGMKEKGIRAAPCVVFYGLSRQDEAKLFAKLQKERRNIASYHRFRAALLGEEKEALAINAITERSGYGIGVGPDVISAVAALESLYRRAPELLERALVIAKEAWKDRHMPDGVSLRGLGRFLHSNEGIDDDRLAQKLSITSPAELKRRASALREGAGGGEGGSDKYMAGAIEAVYERN